VEMKKQSLPKVWVSVIENWQYGNIQSNTHKAKNLLKIQSLKYYHRNKCELSDRHIFTLNHSVKEGDEEM
jgi:hypothetical protein